MPDYQAGIISGSKWKRANRIILDNPLNGIPTALFVEEEVINLDNPDPPITRFVGNISTAFTDPSVEIPLRDTTTWELTGQITTYGALYQALASVYWKLATDRDTVSA